MYTIVDRRTINRERLQETVGQAQRDFLPKLQAASGFVGFYLVADEAHSINTAILLFESKAKFTPNVAMDAELDHFRSSYQASTALDFTFDAPRESSRAPRARALRSRRTSR